MTDLPRNLSNKINKLLEIFPVVLIVGTRQCGKTSLAKSLRPNWDYYDLESAQTFDRISSDLSFFFKENASNIIIDEAQVFPDIFKELRGVIDANRQANNRFIITGSSSPELLKYSSESLAGRLAVVELSPFKINEVLEKPLSPFYQLLESDITLKTLDRIKQLPQISSHEESKKHFLHGGYPKAALAQSEFEYSQWMENYISTYINRDIRSLFPKLNLVKFRRFTRILASVSGQIINKSNIARAIEVSDKTISEYLDIADGTFMWRTIYSLERSLTKSIIKLPKGGYRDSGVLLFQKNIQTLKQLSASADIGHDFEHFVIEEVMRGLNASFVTNWNAYYYRTRGGAEVDLVLKGAFGMLPIEIKYGVSVNPRRLISLKKFVDDYELPFGVVINNADKVIMLTPKIIQIPVTYL